MSLSATEKDKFLQRLSIACEAMQVIVTEEQKTQLIDYLDNLLKWNKTYNLTAIRDPEQGLIQHIFDSLSVVTPLCRYLENNSINSPQIMDVGSGGGLPGAVLAIACKQATVTCVDAVEKKTSFIRQVSSIMKLGNLKAIHTRVEQIEKFNADIVISRAFASLKDFADLAGKHVGKNGRLVGMKGKHPAEEEADLLNQGDWNIEKIEPLQVPDLQAERCLVWMYRKENR